MNIFYNYLVISSHNFDNNSTYTFCCADHNFTGRSTSYAKWTMLGFELNGRNIKTCGLLTTSSNFSVNTTTTSGTFPNKFRKLNEIIALGLVRASNSNSLNNSLLQKKNWQSNRFERESWGNERILEKIEMVGQVFIHHLIHILYSNSNKLSSASWISLNVDCKRFKKSASASESLLHVTSH